ncbi:MAG: type II toxin-antitoxin system HicA family toxin [Gemmatimonadetes bacterium]|nr:type II toxin-antitoxin system HicA family toxin [Gemmatimonadota bacterium]
MNLSGKHLKTLQAVFAEPVRANVKWTDVERLLWALGAEITEGRGSRIRIQLQWVRAVFHRPHPQPEMGKGALKSMRRFLEQVGVKLEAGDHVES